MNLIYNGLPLFRATDPFQLDKDSCRLAAQINEFVRTGQRWRRFFLDQVEENGLEHDIKKIPDIIFPLNVPTIESLFSRVERADRRCEGLNRAVQGK